MTSTRPLLPGVTPSRAQMWQRWLLHSFPGRILLVGVGIKVVTTLAGLVLPPWTLLESVDTVGSLALIFVCCYAIARGIMWAKRRLLWRVRRKLILSYFFVGLVPGLLIIAFFLLAGLILFFNVSSYLLASRVRTLVDQARFMAQSVVVEADHGDPPNVLRSRLEQRQKIAAERLPFTSIALVPMQGLECVGNQQASQRPAPKPVRVGPWQHLDAPDQLPRWTPCDGFAGLLAYDAVSSDGLRTETRFVMRAAALEQARTPRWAVIVDIPFTVAIEQRLRDETGIRLGPGSVGSNIPSATGRMLEQRPSNLDDDSAFGLLQGAWVAVLDIYDWDSGATSSAYLNIRLNLREIYERISLLSTGQNFGQMLLVVLGAIGLLFLVIQFVALVIGVVLARQITGAVHDLFTGTEHLRNRNFTHQIPVRARDQLGELADSFNLMTTEVTKLLRENAAKARMEQEMMAAREIQQKLLPSGPLGVPGLAITAFCEPAREVAGDYYDFLRISETKLGVLIADVSGKGLPAGLYMAQLKVLVQSLARTHTSPRDFLKAVNRVVADNIDSKSFITMSYGVIDFERHEMVYARAGHCPLIRVPGRPPAGMRKSEMLAPDGLVLGLNIDEGQMFDGMIQEEIVPMLPDDLIVFFTDGISETMNEAFDCYGEDRLSKVLEQYSHLPFDQLRSFISADLRAFAGKADQHDDMTMILLRVEKIAALLPS